ncbi:MAG: hypothetical protein AB7T05_00605 [Fimbriimonadaceae bacterium]
MAFIVLPLVFMGATEIGFWVGLKSKPDPSEGRAEPENLALGFVMTLLSLILAFTLNSAHAYYRARSEMIPKEVQAIRAARLSLEVLADDVRTQAEMQFNAYIKSIVKYNNALYRSESPQQAFNEQHRVLHEIRRLCRAQLDSSGPYNGREPLEAIDRLSEVGLERHVLLLGRNGEVVIEFLLELSGIACFLMGFSHHSVRKRIWWATILLTAVIACTVTLISDYNSPRLGLIRLDASDAIYQALLEE